MRSRRAKLLLAGAVCVAGVLAFLFLVPHRANGYHAASLEGAASLRRAHGFLMVSVPFENRSSRFGASIQSAKPVGLNIETTKPGIFLEDDPPAHEGVPYAWIGWPPQIPGRRNRRLNALLRTLPSLPHARVVPPHRQALVIFAMRSTAPPGATIRLTAVEIQFRQHWMPYRWRLPARVVVPT
jgi:hypothetical protein